MPINIFLSVNRFKGNKTSPGSKKAAQSHSRSENVQRIVNALELLRGSSEEEIGRTHSIEDCLTAVVRAATDSKATLQFEKIKN